MTSQVFRGLAVVAGAAAVVAAGLAAVPIVIFGNFEAVFLLGPIGGVAAAIVLAHAHAGRHPLTVPDPFARDLVLFDVVNIAHIRVAGVGGLGLLFVAAVVVLQFQLLTAAYAAGILGGLCCAAWLIVYRRTHRATRPSQAFEHL